jgi:MarR family transcriptional regulator for hemolysin
LVTRKEAPGDRRGKTLALTQRAEPIVDEIQRVVSESRQQVLGDISDEDIATCVRVFRHVRGKIAAYDQPHEIDGRAKAGVD